MPTEDELRLLAQPIRHHINSTLCHVDRALCELEWQAESQGIHSVLYHANNTLSAEAKTQFRERLRAIREIFTKIKVDLGFESEVQDIGRLIWNRCSFLQVDLLELEPRYLRGYGEPPAWLAGYLAPLMQELIGLLGAEYLSGKSKEFTTSAPNP